MFSLIAQVRILSGFPFFPGTFGFVGEYRKLMKANRKKILLTGATGNMGLEGLKLLSEQGDRFELVVFALPTKKDKKILGDQFCRSCNYCQPCSQGIPISNILRTETQVLRRMGWSEGRVKMVKNAKDNLDTCIHCGLCVRMCNEQMMASAIGFSNRGQDIHIDTPFQENSERSCQS